MQVFGGGAKTRQGDHSRRFGALKENEIRVCLDTRLMKSVAILCALYRPSSGEGWRKSG